MRFFDTHFHLDPEDDGAVIIPAARAASVQGLARIGCELADSRQAQKEAEELGMAFSAGVHPHYIDKFDGDLAPFRELYQHPRCVAVGEIGLDFHYHREDDHKQRQIAVFEAFLGMSKENGKPAVIHCRDAFPETLESLRRVLNGQVPFILHCYTGDLSQVRDFLDLGGYISYSGIVTFSSAKALRESLQAVPDDRLLIETDSPWLAPIPFRGRRNSPAYVPHVAARVAAERQISVEALAELTWANACRVFQLPADGGVAAE